MSELVVKVDSCKIFIEKILLNLGITQNIALKWADLLVETSLLNFDSHGISMLERYISHIQGGGININEENKIVSENGSCMLIDANGGLGHISADFATKLAIQKAKEFGISCVSVRNCNHIGACGLYVRRAALNDCIGICTTVSRSSMAPWGGKIPLLGSNPIAISAPIEGRYPFLYDVASTVVSMGKITAAKDKNFNIPSEWALDKQGWPTTNPAAAITGSLLPFGGHKGYGLAMVVEILSSFLSGGVPSKDVKSWISQTKDPIGASCTFIVIDISAFQNVDLFKSCLKNWIENIINSQKREGFDRICYPGQIEGENYEYRSKNGIPIFYCDYEMFEKLAAKFDIEKPQMLKV